MAIDWQAKFTQLVGIVDPTRSFPEDFAWDDEKTIDALAHELREAAQTDHAVENATLKRSLAAKDEAEAVRQRMKAAGFTDEDLQKVRTK